MIRRLELERRLERDLGHIADRAIPSTTTWSDIEARRADQPAGSTAEVINLDDPEDDTSLSGRRLLLLAAAAVVSVVAITAALVSRGGAGRTGDPELIDVADQDGTAALDPIKAEAIDEFVAALNAGDVERLLAAFGPGAQFGSTMLDTASTRAPIDEMAELSEFFAFLADRRAQVTIGRCEEASSGEVECRGWYQDEVVELVDGYLSGSAEGFTLRLTAMADDDGLSLLTMTPTLPRGVVGGFEDGLCRLPCRPTPWVTSAGYLAFLEWLDINHPGERAVLMDDTEAYPIMADPGPDDFVRGAFPRFTPEARALWLTRVGQWRSTLDS